VACEEGVVIRVDAGGTWVKTVRGEVCDGCSSKGACHTMGGGKEMEVAVVNPIEARVGDRVLLKLGTSPFLKATFLIYMFPILLLVAGTTVGEWISRSFGIDSPLPSALLGFGSLAAGLGLMKIIAQRLAEKDEYRPRIARVIGRVEG
jgi:sigma-E factor negative regulatory protein RseC